MAMVAAETIVVDVVKAPAETATANEVEEQKVGEEVDEGWVAGGQGAEMMASGLVVEAKGGGDEGGCDDRGGDGGGSDETLVMEVKKTPAVMGGGGECRKVAPV